MAYRYITRKVFLFRFTHTMCIPFVLNTIECFLHVVFYTCIYVYNDICKYNICYTLQDTDEEEDEEEEEADEGSGVVEKVPDVKSLIKSLESSTGPKIITPHAYKPPGAASADHRTSKKLLYHS